jgi:ubiquinone/menaquinone biosynthesis C-methylase UbiE
MPLLKPFLERMFRNAEEANHANIRRMCVKASRPGDLSMLDLGCDDASWTLELAHAAGATHVEGVEVMADAVATARGKGVLVHEIDLNQPLPLDDERFDLVHSNQVIEHVNDVDLFVAEVFRVLKKGGLAVISTENGSSWHNVFAAILGWQIFSLTNVSGRVAGLGNPFAIQRGATAFSPTWRHKTIMNYLGLKELMTVNGFVDVTVAGAGYYPLPAAVGRADARHAAFITVSGRKPQ